MNDYGETREKIIRLLSITAMSIDELIVELGISKSGVRKQISKIKADDQYQLLTIGTVSGWKYEIKKAE